MTTDAQAKWDSIKAGIREQLTKLPGSPTENSADMHKAMYDLANDLTYPVDPEGNAIDIHWLIPMLSFHLARCGYQRHDDKALIKQIPHPRRGSPGIVDDAVLFVPVDRTGEIPEIYRNMPDDAPEALIPWKTKTHITLDGETIKGGK
jgi:hypothetical protein